MHTRALIAGTTQQTTYLYSLVIVIIYFCKMQRQKLQNENFNVDTNVYQKTK